MTKYVVAVSIEKVQAFLYAVVRAHEQEKQTEKETLRGVMRASQEISLEFRNKVEIAFRLRSINIEKEDIFLFHSGEFIFSVEADELTIREVLRKLFADYYKEFNGQMLLRYTYFEKEEDSNAITMAQRNLRKNSCIKSIIEENAELLFIAIAVSPDDFETAQYDATKHLGFAENINDLYSGAGKNEEHFRIAVIKADLDGMGDFFGAVLRQNRKGYTCASLIFSEVIGLEYLNRIAVGMQENDPKFKLFPIYIAGDDIFFAVAVNHLILGVDVCRRIVRDLKKELREKLLGIGEVENVEDIIEEMKLSIGIEINFNSQPIRYYYERIEEGQVKIAKKAVVEPTLDPFVDTKICINGFTFLDINEDACKKERKCRKEAMDSSNKDNLNTAQKKYNALDNAYKNAPHWGHFIHDVKFINYLNNETNDLPGNEEHIGSKSFFYNLLERLNDPALAPENTGNMIAISNAIFYHLLPQYLTGDSKELKTKRDQELYLNTMLIKQLYQKQNKSGKYALDFRSQSLKRFRTYIELMLLFTDKERFGIQKKDDYPFKYDAKEQKKTRSRLFNTPLEFIFNNNLSALNIRDLFVGNARYNALQGKGDEDGKITYYRTLKIEKAMFFRMMNIKEFGEKEIKHLTEIISVKNQIEEKDAKEFADNNNKNNKPFSRLGFNAGSFVKRVKEHPPDRENLESLLLFYQYNDNMITFKGAYKKKITVKNSNSFNRRR